MDDVQEEVGEYEQGDYVGKFQGVTVKLLTGDGRLDLLRYGENEEGGNTGKGKSFLGLDSAVSKKYDAVYGSKYEDGKYQYHYGIQKEGLDSICMKILEFLMGK